MNVVIVDYNMGNLHSVYKKLRMLDVQPVVSSNVDEILRADKLILPGVGHFQKAMQQLRVTNLVEVLNEKVITKRTPILGICLGMQLFAKSSEEGNCEGLGWIDASVVRFQINDTLTYKVPHTGWNQISIAKQSTLMNNISNGAEFYFVHSYHFKTNDPTAVLNETEYEYRFVSAVERDCIFGVQYHPEKSHDVGSQLLANFLKL